MARVARPPDVAAVHAVDRDSWIAVMRLSEPECPDDEKAESGGERRLAELQAAPVDPVGEPLLRSVGRLALAEHGGARQPVRHAARACRRMRNACVPDRFPARSHLA